MIEDTMKDVIDKLKSHDKMEIAYKTGLSMSTIEAIFRGYRSSVSVKTLSKLQKFIQDKEAGNGQ